MSWFSLFFHFTLGQLNHAATAILRGSAPLRAFVRLRPFPRPFIGKLLGGRANAFLSRRAIPDSFVGLPHSPCFISNAALVQLCSLNSPDIPKIAHLFVQFADVAQFLNEYVRR